MCERLLGMTQVGSGRGVQQCFLQWWQLCLHGRYVSGYQELERQIATERDRVSGHSSEVQRVRQQYANQLSEERQSMAAELAEEKRKAASKEAELAQSLQQERMQMEMASSRDANEVASVYAEINSIRGQLASVTQVR